MPFLFLTNRQRPCDWKKGQTVWFRMKSTVNIPVSDIQKGVIEAVFGWLDKVSGFELLVEPGLTKITGFESLIAPRRNVVQITYNNTTAYTTELEALRAQESDLLEYIKKLDSDLQKAQMRLSYVRTSLWGIEK